jgi:hypothetical protein
VTVYIRDRRRLCKDCRADISGRARQALRCAPCAAKYRKTRCRERMADWREQHPAENRNRNTVHLKAYRGRHHPVRECAADGCAVDLYGTRRKWCPEHRPVPSAPRPRPPRFCACGARIGKGKQYCADCAAERAAARNRRPERPARSCACGADITARPASATRCAECQIEHRQNRDRYQRVMRACEECGADIRGRAKGAATCAPCEPKPPRWCIRCGSADLAGTRQVVCDACSQARRYPAEHAVWAAARNRCLNEDNREYFRYGGRGLTVCAHLGTFAGFLAEVGPRPDPALQIERLNNDLGYWCGACAGKRQLKWATREEHAANRHPPGTWTKRQDATS